MASNYIDKIMSNHVFNSESSEDVSYLYSETQKHHGGDSSGNQQKLQRSDKPIGGFPPIYILDPKEKEIEQSKNRQLGAKKVGISIKDILRSKK
jgi:hypothetical protein